MAFSRRLELKGKILAYAAGLIGLTLAVILIVIAGSGDVLRVLESAGWGLFWLVPLHLAPVLLESAAWQSLLRARSRVKLPFAYVAWTTAVREAVNNLLPVARVGGELIGVRLLRRRRIRAAVGAASLVVLLTLTALDLYLLTLAGLGLLLSNIPATQIAGPVAAGLLALLPAMLLLVIVQRYGKLFARLDRLIEIVTGGHKLLSRLVRPDKLDAEIRSFYGRFATLTAAAGWKLLSLAAEAAEVWVIMFLLHHPIAVWQAIVMETLSLAARAAAFVVPAGIGVQEGGFVLIGQLIGVPADFAIAVSLAKRFREIAFGLPSIASWQWVEGRHLHRLLHGGRRRAAWKKTESADP